MEFVSDAEAGFVKASRLIGKGWGVAAHPGRRWTRRGTWSFETFSLWEGRSYRSSAAPFPATLDAEVVAAARRSAFHWRRRRPVGAAAREVPNPITASQVAQRGGLGRGDRRQARPRAGQATRLARVLPRKSRPDRPAETAVLGSLEQVGSVELVGGAACGGPIGARGAARRRGRGRPARLLLAVDARQILAAHAPLPRRSAPASPHRTIRKRQLALTPRLGRAGRPLAWRWPRLLVLARGTDLARDRRAPLAAHRPVHRPPAERRTTTHPARAARADAGATLVQQDDYGKLWRTELRLDDEPVTVVEVTNATQEPDGSYRRYWLRVPPNVRSARHAVAWSFGFERVGEHDCGPDVRER
jgi:hypothetical protein